MAQPNAVVWQADWMLERALAFGWRLVGASDIFAFQFADLGEIDLPPAMRPAAEQADLRAVAPLYLASELEAARLIPAVETLAGLFVSGGLGGDLGEASALLFRFWQGRNTRFASQEREAFLARLFGGRHRSRLAVESSYNAAFESLMLDVTEAIYHLDEPGRSASQVSLRLAANRLAENLIVRGGGMTGYVARDLLNTTQEAINILKNNAVQRAVGAQSVWQAVGNISHQYLNEAIDVSSHVIRGKNGLIVLAWLAESLPQLDDTAAVLVPEHHPVIEAAASWLLASLNLAETESAPAEQGNLS